MAMAAGPGSKERATRMASCAPRPSVSARWRRVSRCLPGHVRQTSAHPTLGSLTDRKRERGGVGVCLGWVVWGVARFCPRVADGLVCGRGEATAVAAATHLAAAAADVAAAATEAREGELEGGASLVPCVSGGGAPRLAARAAAVAWLMAVLAMFIPPG